jgi:N-acetylglucosamine-6-phosphate deacetylase
MNSRWLINNARVPGFQSHQQICIENHRITAIVPISAPEASISSARSTSIIDVEGDWISLGGVDLQINGALGLAFPDLDSNCVYQLGQIGQFLWQQGITAYCPTLVTTSLDKMHRSLSCIGEYISAQADRPVQDSATATILGVHLEGPCLNPQKRGAHPQQFLLPLTSAHLRRILGDYASIIKIVTLAPELDATGTVIPYLKSLGITVSLGHSQATAEQANQAFAQGATMVTHAFNAMPPLHHRQPGLLGAAIVHPQVYCGLIADGQHVCPTMMDILLRASQYDYGIFLVSDALSPLGLPDGRYPWDTRTIQVTDGTARLDDGTLVGTTRSLLSGVDNLVQWDLCTVEQAISLATLAPRRSLSDSNCPSMSIYLGESADFLRWSYIPTTQQLKWSHLSL